jgi:hypothetical protein
VRLTPKLLFFAFVVCGLPFAVTLGWALGETTPAKPPAAATPGGVGSIGRAPERDKPVEYPETTATPRRASSAAPVAVRPRVADPTHSPSPAVPSVTVAPSDSTPSPTPSVEPSGVDLGDLLRIP